MLKKIEFFTNKKIKLSIRLIFILTFFGGLLETLSIASLPLFLNFILNFEQSISAFENISFLNFLEELSFDNFIYTFLTIIILLFVIKNLFLIFLNYFQVKTFKNFAIFNANFFYENYFAQRISFFVENNPSKLIRNISQEILQLNKVLQHSIYIYSEILILLLFLTILLISNFKLTLIAFSIVSIFYVLYYFLIKNDILKKGEELLEFRQLILKILNEDFNLINQIKISKTENFFHKRFKKEYNVYEKNKLMFSVIQFIPKYLFETILVLLFVISFYLIFQSGGKYEILKAIPQITLFILASIRIFPAVSRIVQYLNSINLNVPSLNLLISEKKKILKNIDNFKLKENKIINPKKSIELKNVTISQKNMNINIVQDLSLVIKINSLSYIIGKSGAGKSTIINILLGFLKPSKGKIFIDDLDVTNFQYTIDKIGMVSQDMYLLDDTIKANIALGVKTDKIDNFKIDQLIKSCKLESLIARNKYGINKIIGTRGIILSGGEKQKIALARALYNDPDLLILDEPTSSLDEKDEKEFISIIKNFQRKKTIIIITHNLNIIENDDQVYLIENGSLINYGNYSKIKLSQKNLNLKK
jgi:ABC-type multidrug transport system fused ATPase/permease subunit